MDFCLEADRMILSVIDETYVDRLLLFCEENADIFMKYEQAYPDNYFTRSYQELLIKGAVQQFIDQKGLRYYLFTKDDPRNIIGCVGLSDIKFGPDRTAKLYYKLDRLHVGMGYATEAVSCLLWHAAEDLSLHRIEADILPENARSRSVVKRLGFEYEGIAKSSHCVNGEWKDHERWALIL